MKSRVRIANWQVYIVIYITYGKSLPYLQKIPLFHINVSLFG